MSEKTIEIKLLGLLGENTTLKERNKDLCMDLQDAKCHRKSCLEKIDHQREALNIAEEKHSDFIATAMKDNIKIKELKKQLDKLLQDKKHKLEENDKLLQHEKPYKKPKRRSVRMPRQTCKTCLENRRFLGKTCRICLKNKK